MLQVCIVLPYTVFKFLCLESRLQGRPLAGQKIVLGAQAVMAVREEQQAMSKQYCPEPKSLCRHVAKSMTACASNDASCQALLCVMLCA